MYASYFVGEFGFLWAFPTAHNATILLVWAVAQILRIHAEEALLKQDPLYSAYCATVRWRLIPGVY
jgi:protein-S-isoprenylcysteine O-methyltransferase Ste14